MLDFHKDELKTKSPQPKKMELQTWAHALNQALGIHVMLGLKNGGEYFERPVDEHGDWKGDFFRGVEMHDNFWLSHGKNNIVSPNPQLPGLGVDLDWDEIQKISIRHLVIE